MKNCTEWKWCNKLNLLVIILIIICTFTACNKTEKDIYGNYIFEDIAYVGGLSSASRDYLYEKQVGTKYAIKPDNIIISNAEKEISFSNIKYKKVFMDKEYIEKNFNDAEFNLTNLIEKYQDKYRIYLYDENGEIIPFYLFLLDEEVFIGEYDKSGILLTSLNKLKAVE